MSYNTNKKMGTKINRTFRWFFAPAAILGIVTALPKSALAATCGETTTFFDWGCSGTGEQVTPVLIQILNWLAVGVSIAVVGGVIYGAIMYTTSGGNQQQTQKAIGIIRNAFVALIMYFVAWSFLNWLVPGGLFN